MPVITPATRPDLPELTDDEFVGMVLTDVSSVESTDYNDPSKPKIFTVLEMRLDAEDAEVLSVWCSQALGMNRKTGQVSKLRQALNAFARRPETDEIASFDTDDHSWLYRDGAAFNLEPGMRIEVRGTNVMTAEGVHRFTVDKLRPVRRVAQPVAADVPF
jgi:hypothetical protein